MLVHVPPRGRGGRHQALPRGRSPQRCRSPWPGSAARAAAAGGQHVRQHLHRGQHRGALGVRAGRDYL